MRIACLGGGPAGLYFAITMKLRDPAHEIIVFERNRPDDTFGWGVVFSDETLDNLPRTTRSAPRRSASHFAYWDDIAVDFRGQRIVSTGHGFCGIGRKQLLLLLQDTRAGARRRAAFRDGSRRVGGLRPRLRSRRRGGRAEFKNPHANSPSISSRTSTARKCKFVWLGTQSEIRRRVHLHLRGDRARLGVGARLSVRRGHGDVHRRMLRRDLGEIRLRRDDARSSRSRPASASSRTISAAIP